jgi:hypothetical protein
LHYEKFRSDVFSEYIKPWLKLKAEASGYPKDCITNEQKVQYVADFEEREGILLDKENINSNPGLRFIAKLMLNR